MKGSGETRGSGKTGEGFIFALDKKFLPGVNMKFTKTMFKNGKDFIHFSWGVPEKNFKRGRIFRSGGEKEKRKI